MEFINMGVMEQALLFMLAGLLLVPVFKRLGLGSVLGYLAGGVLIGPDGFGLISDVDEILHFSELGVVFLLFLIGLELRPERLWSLRKPVFGLGGAQVVVTAVPITGLAMWFGAGVSEAVTIGIGLALSSTAFCLQILAEKGHLRTAYGRNAFSILLFQDLAVVPLLAIIPLLALVPSIGGGLTLEGAQDAVPDAWAVALALSKAIGMIALVAVGGHYLVGRVLTIMVRTGLPELFTAAALALVLGVSALMHAVGLSAALGAFLAGVLLADSDYRHELEATLQPFKGLLLGLFFIAVGMSVDLDLIAAMPLVIIGMTIGLLALKSAVLFGAAIYFGSTIRSAASLAALLPQGGEFGFVVFTLAVASGVMDPETAALLLVIVTLSMVVTPFLVEINGRLQDHAVKRQVTEKPAYDTIQEGDEENRVIIAGFGRIGQIVARTLRMAGIPFTALEMDFDQVEFVRRFGNKVYFGDPSQPDLLRAAGIETAEVFVIAVHDDDKAIQIAEYVHKRYPHVKIYARVRNRQQAYRMMEVGVRRVFRETYGSSLEIAERVFRGLGYDKKTARRTVSLFRKHDEEMMEEQFKIHHDEEALIRSATQFNEELRGLFERDEMDHDAEYELPPITVRPDGDDLPHPYDKMQAASKQK